MPQLDIRNLRVRSLDVERNEVAWEIDGYEDPRDYTTVVARSESPRGPFEAITPPFEDRYLFVDSRLPRGSKLRQLYYKLIITKKSDLSVTETEPVTNTAEPDLVASYVRVNELVLFTQAIGRLTWLLKKRTFGPACRACRDAVTGQRRQAQCKSCFNTGFLRGYHNPIEVWAQIDPAGKNESLTPQQKGEHILTTARMPYFPIVSPGDLLIEAENRRWEVLEITQTERLRAVVRQELKLRHLETTDIEYQLPLNLETAVRDIQPSPVRMYSMAPTLASAVYDRIPDIFGSYTTYPKDPTR